MEGGEIVAFIVFGMVIFGLFMFKQKRLEDPTNTTFIYPEQMLSSHQLPQGPVEAVLFRQSGNEYRNLGIFPSPDAALLEVIKSFRRANIESVSVLKNDSSRYEAPSPRRTATL